ncbi:DNA methyltransferase [Pseudomonas sp. DTU_2021_1001937_2_SI_NGA_ILE_001]|uniref:DNA-methyltransferase n=1 Tax=Pseudomonas sp. DTU_2021_1001937_2_SI_NGA_ILE_001 TaxID=3077589 RepID=UPI0028FC11F5|nr:DNA methyltransferase [Pseudomonas sp. DTU_2021_1001937_2_SI_NGA_ILE_001]WNW10092.1 DNA methyltransferase [Pseudomonas sp. DTU_2021_1001937_2_SI_NGA_ILE_001]
MSFTLHLGDCLEVLRTLPDDSIDSVVTDPPYGIRFMGKSWDGADIEQRAAYRAGMPSHAEACGPNGGHRSVAAEAGKYDLTPKGMRAFQAFTLEWASECLRVLKPGGHLLSFAAARTYHHMAVGIEMAGFEIRDQIMWVFGSGFPKSHNLKGDRAGWGTALKPAHEPICMARKPLTGTVADNVQRHGTGAINIDACRVEAVDAERLAKHWDRETTIDMRGGNFVGGRSGGVLQTTEASALGRWPANLVHDGSPEVVAMFPAEAGASAPVKGSEPTANGFSGSVAYSGMMGRVQGAFHGDSGSAARFFYCAKASRKDRNEGLHSGVTPAVATSATMRNIEDADWSARNGNHHPTVKPTDLMAYLCRLVTPAGGLVLDPFTGSGSTGKAAIREGFRFIGCELDPEYLTIARARIEHEVTQQALKNQQPDLFG